MGLGRSESLVQTKMRYRGNGNVTVSYETPGKSTNRIPLALSEC